MTIAGWLKQAVESATFLTATGRAVRVVEVADTGLVLAIRGHKQRTVLPMRELRAAIALGGRLGVLPNAPQLRAVGIQPERAVYLRALLQEIAATPGAAAWIAALLARQAHREAHSSIEAPVNPRGPV